MVNMSIPYRGPSPALLKLTQELRAKYGDPARTYEFVTGYKSASNVSSHNADSNGTVHAVDIFVGPGNLTEAQGITTVEQLRAEGTRGTIDGHPDRLAYIIHRGRIAGDHTGWAWAPYTGADWHGDHIHVSGVFDYYWGDPVPVHPSNYNSTIPWNLGVTVTKPQGSKPTPIPQKDWFDMATKADLKAAIWEVLGENLSASKAVKQAGTVGWAVMNGRNHAEIAGNAAKKAVAEVSALRSVVEQLADGQGVTIDYAKVESAAAAGVAKAIAEGVDLDATVTIKGGAQ